MTRNKFFMGSLLVAVGLGLGFVPAPVSGQDITQSIKEQQQRAREREERLKKLSRQESRLSKDVQATENRIKRLEAAIDKQEKELHGVEAELQKVSGRLDALTRKTQASQEDLAKLLATLWPLSVQRDSTGVIHPEGWDAASRRYIWTKTLYEKVDARQKELQKQQLEVEKTLEERQALAESARKKLAAVNADKKDLLQDKLQYRRKLKSVKQDKASAEAELRNVLDVIRGLNFKLEKQRGGKDIALLKGVLPWPATGSVVKRYKPKASPPVRGIGLRVAKGTPVQAVAWGKVMHNDVLRGFGRVVILMHGEEYYSLYAYLSESSAQVGENVKQGDLIGTAGFYPDVNSDGLYFELRFHQKAINPESWLTSLK